jgi:FtsP/CotA-like multicopper oxidase with cupredoxin domain
MGRRWRRLPRPVRWLIGLVGLGLVTAGGFLAWTAAVWLTIPVDTVGEVDFNEPLAIPPVATSRLVDDERVFDLKLQQGTTDFGHGQTPTWGIDGPYLGPTIRVSRGDKIRMRIDNQLPETTTVHWHGMHLPAEMDGGPHQPIAPGEVWEPYWRIDQTAATLWYHPHLHGESATHVYRGLAGMFLIDDPISESLPLPREYGVDDIPVILQDKKFHDDGTLDEDPAMFQSAGVTGETVVVNGTVGPYLEVTTELVRLRLLNASTTRPYAITLANGGTFDMIASGGGLLAAPVTLNRIQLSAGERAEIVIALDPGETAVLRSGPTDTGDRMAGGADHLDLLQLRAADTLTSSPPLPTTLADQPTLSEADADRTRTFELSGSRSTTRPWTRGASMRSPPRETPRSGRSPTSTAAATTSTSMTSSSRSSTSTETRHRPSWQARMNRRGFRAASL